MGKKSPPKKSEKQAAKMIALATVIRARAQYLLGWAGLIRSTAWMLFAVGVVIFALGRL